MILNDPRLCRTLPLVASFLLILDGPAASQSESGASTARESKVQLETVDAIFAPWNRWDSPGASVAVLRDGEILYERGYGAADLETRTAITKDTIFHVASVSKQFTDFALVLLEQDGVLELDDDVRKHLPEMPDYGQPLTLRHLAHHTSGVRDQWELLAISGTRLDDVITTEHVLKLATRLRELNFEPGSEYLYSNMGFTLLAETVARVSGRTFPEFCQERIFKPLGMTRTHFHDDHQHLVPGRAYSYSGAGGNGWEKAVLSYANAGATSLFTTAGDLARWLQNLETGSVGGKAGIETLLTKGVLNNGEEIDYALGLVHGEFRGLESLSHGGADAGFRSTVLYLPEHRFGVVVLANSPVVDPGARAGEVAAVFLEDELEPLPEEETQASEDGSEPVEVSVDRLEQYAGNYLLEELDAVISVSLDEERLVAEIPGQGEVELKAVSQTRFSLDTMPGTIEFAASVDGRSPSFEVSLPGQKVMANRIDLDDSVAVEAYVGWYLSPELETFYRIGVDGDGGLMARHVRNDDIKLLAAGKDEFKGDQWFFGSVRFERGESGAVEGFRLSGGRVKNLLFQRVDGTALGLE